MLFFILEYLSALIYYFKIKSNFRFVLIASDDDAGLDPVGCAAVVGGGELPHQRRAHFRVHQSHARTRNSSTKTP